jgi:hypothetical protein
LSALDAQVKSNFDAITMGLSWREVAFLISDDAGLNAAADSTALSTLLPLSDDDGTQLVIGDFADGDILLSRNTAGTDKVYSVFDDSGTLRITTVGVDQPATGDVHIVKNDLPDGDGQETSAMYTYNGTDYVKIGDIDWQLATGIDLSSGYAAAGAAAAPVGGDSVETAIGKLHKDADDIRTTTGTARGDTDMGNYTGDILTDAQNTKTNIQELEDAIQAGGVRVEQLNVTTQVVLDTVPLADADVVHWVVYARGDTDPTQRFSSTMRAMHDGTAIADLDSLPFLQDPANKLDVTFDVDISGADMRLLVQVDEVGGGDCFAVRRTMLP